MDKASVLNPFFLWGSFGLNRFGGTDILEP